MDTYELGIDLGTTFTAAAIRRDGKVDIVPLGSRSPVIPSVIFLADDGSTLTGEAAQRRALTEPTRVAREFKRRIGDSTPVIVAGEPHSAESLSAKLLKAVVAEVTKLEGGPPSRIALTHPANWREYKKDLYVQAVRIADLPDAVFLTEPEAAALHYASQERVESGSVIAVYDLGGGTFDASLLRKTDDGFELLGRPEGIERLGGIDFDEAVFAHVLAVLDLDIATMDRTDPAVLSGISRLRQECVEAKEALSADTEAAIPVALPGLHTEVRITRPELESMVRRPIADTVGAMHRTLRDAGLEPGDLTNVLLVGGSSRIPMVAEMVASELGRPVSVDTHPKYAIAMGAARFAGSASEMTAVAHAPDPVTTAPGVDTSSADAPPPAAAAVEPIPTSIPTSPATDPDVTPDATDGHVTEAPTDDHVTEAPTDGHVTGAPTAAVTSPVPSAPEPTRQEPSPELDRTPDPVAPTPGERGSVVRPIAAAASFAPPHDESMPPQHPIPESSPITTAPTTGQARRRPVALLAGAAAAVVAVAVVAGLALGGGGGDDEPAQAGAAADAGDGCPTEGPFICITTAQADGGAVRAAFRTIGQDLSSATTASFFLESAPSQNVLWDSPDPFAAQVGDVAASDRICALLNDDSGTPVTGTGNCVPFG